MTMRARTIAAGLVAISLVAAGLAPAGAQTEATHMNTFYGPSGLMRVPTADIAAVNKAQVGIGLVENEWTLNANYGLTPYSEIGATLVNQNASDTKAIVAAKLRVEPSNISWFDLGLGTIDPFDTLDDSYYLVASTKMMPISGEYVGFRAHLGYGTGIFNEDPIGGGELHLDRHFAVVGEYDGRRGNFALRYNHLRQPFTIQAGVAESDFFISATTTLEF